MSGFAIIGHPALFPELEAGPVSSQLSWEKVELGWRPSSYDPRPDSCAAGRYAMNVSWIELYGIEWANYPHFWGSGTAVLSPWTWWFALLVHVECPASAECKLSTPLVSQQAVTLVRLFSRPAVSRALYALPSTVPWQPGSTLFAWEPSASLDETKPKQPQALNLSISMKTMAPTPFRYTRYLDLYISLQIYRVWKCSFVAVEVEPLKNLTRGKAKWNPKQKRIFDIRSTRPLRWAGEAVVWSAPRCASAGSFLRDSKCLVITLK